MKRVSRGVRKQLLNLLFVVILVGITLTVLLVNNKELNFANIGAFFKSCDPVWMASAFLCMLLSILFEALSLHIIAHRFDHKCGFHSSLAYATADVYYSAITPSASGGQPASVFYMARDGMSVGKASFTLLFNLIGYATAIIIIGVSAFAVNPGMYTEIEPWFAHFLIILGIILQVVLLGFAIACMFCGGAVKKFGNGIITLLFKIKIVKNPDKWRTKVADEVNKYSDCRKEIKKNPLLFTSVIFCNISQRLSHILISCFVCFSSPDVSVSFADIYVMQVFVLLGYNCVPLPGGTGAFEYLYLSIYRLRFDDAFIPVIMLIARVLSYYIRSIISAVYTLTYHMVGGKKKLAPPQSEEENTADDSLQPEACGVEIPCEAAVADETVADGTVLPQKEENYEKYE